ncbi:hypothetical protein XA1314C_06880 [Xanthomonas arboricola]|uniref:Uncharacterized protein n=1 Tax=Xanthomonas arboricola TaxID=56448 RepID=A0AAU9HQJ9_9XANT|nr:hypothetical protein XA1314C_06880 [Xanthomonas arboricola]CAE6711525.1 hypothetical protein XA1314C_06880 [Xanthomonas arboricola]
MSGLAHVGAVHEGCVAPVIAGKDTAPGSWSVAK